MTKRNIWVLALLLLPLAACASTDEPAETMQEETVEAPAHVPPLIHRMRTLEAEVRGVAADRAWSAQFTGDHRVERAWLRGTTLLLEAFDAENERWVAYSINAATGRSNWIVVLGDQRLERAPHVGDGSIAFLTEHDNGMVLVNSRTGSRIDIFKARMQVVAASDATSGPATVYVGNHLTNRLVAAAPDGRKGWDWRTNGLCTTTPVLTRGLPNQMLVYATDGGEVGALPAKAFNEVPPRNASWKRQLAGGVTGDPREIMIGSGDEARSLLLVPCHDGFFYGIDPATGRSLWQPLRTDAAFKSTPHAANGKIFVRNDDRMFCLDANTGKRAWWPASMAQADDYDKEQLFATPEGFEVADRLLAANDDRVYLLQNPNIVMRCNAETGKVEGAYPLTSFDFILTNESTGTLVVGTHDGIFMAFQ